MTAAPPIDTEPEPSAPERGRSRVRHRRRLLRVLLAIGVVAGAVWTAGEAIGRFRPHLYAGTVLQAPTPAPGFDGLRLASGEPLDLAAFEGDVALLYFGYTNCPDICPTTLSMVARARAALPESLQERTHLVMVSVDPLRDDLDSLQEYVQFFDPSFVGAGGDVADIDRVAAQYGVYHQLGEGTPETGYTVDHTATLLGVGPDGRLRLVWGPEISSDALRADIEALLV